MGNEHTTVEYHIAVLTATKQKREDTIHFWLDGSGQTDLDKSCDEDNRIQIFVGAK